MKRWALMNGADCANVVEQADEPTIGGDWVEVTGTTVGPGHSRDGSTWHAPAVVASWSAIELYRRMTAAERIAIRNAAASDPVILDFNQTMDHMIASGQTVYANDPDLQAGLAYLQAHPSGSPIFSSARVAQLLAP